jgi:trans-aconitate 2-methyltransferase
MNSAKFYDDFITYQIDTGINDRIYNLYKRLCKLGISSGTNILEIGCGIGALTYLLSRKIKKGKIEAIDISPKSIEYARANLNQPNLLFSLAGILEYEPASLNFDIILLFDVLEHIPENEHFLVFSRISKWMNHNSLLLINLPNPHYILFERKNNPQGLQEIDQPIFMYNLANDLAKAHFNIEYFETYSVWVKNDYQFLVIKKESEFVKQFLKTDDNIFKRLKVRLGREIRKLLYSYPRIHK